MLNLLAGGSTANREDNNNGAIALSARRCAMRRHRSVFWFVTAFFLMGLAGCSTESTKSETPPPSQIAQARPTKPLPSPLPGEFAIKTYLKEYSLTVVGGGGVAGNDTIHTDAPGIRAWEKFRLWRDPTIQGEQYE